MGIDRKDVRMVCHFNIPKSMEAFYQESGRAGRDQLASRSLLYYGMDDRKRMEFILSKAENQKSRTSSSQEVLSKKSISDFKQMVEYCESSGCRRKKILESFGEQVPISLCNKSCDACKHPNLVAKNLEELTTACAIGQKNSFSRIFISSQDMTNDRQMSEFWNRDDEASGSEEDISDADDDMEFVKNFSKSKLSTKSGLNAKIEFLQRAEESYYQNKYKEVNKFNKNAISESLREASKQRLSNALKQAQERLGNLSIEIETSSSFLEKECFEKYGKSGKSFYYSQVASTIRWLSTTDSTELTNRLGTSCSSCHSATDTCREEPPAAPSPLLDQQPAETTNQQLHSSTASETSKTALTKETASSNTRLPVIPSFSEFVNCKKAKNQLDTSQKQTPKQNLEKKMRLK